VIVLILVAQLAHLASLVLPSGLVRHTTSFPVN
jgi:hypothetical protein